MAGEAEAGEPASRAAEAAFTGRERVAKAVQAAAGAFEAGKLAGRKAGRAVRTAGGWFLSCGIWKDVRRERESAAGRGAVKVFELDHGA